ncbi:ribosome-binding factor A [Candidatus Berkelbacteria bacterium]|nr:ribosome-binding factor A [Candidatus Berkelbacteria bacterium]
MKQQLAMLVSRLRDSDVGMISIDVVDVAPSLTSANVFVSVIDGSDQKAVLAFLESKRAQFQSYIAKHDALKSTPVLKFILSQSPNTVNRLDAIFEKLHNQS